MYKKEYVLCLKELGEASKVEKIFELDLKYMNKCTSIGGKKVKIKFISLTFKYPVLHLAFCYLSYSVII